jgi:hypothetical protein
MNSVNVNISQKAISRESHVVHSMQVGGRTTKGRSTKELKLDARNRYEESARERSQRRASNEELSVQKSRKEGTTRTL